MSFVVQTQNRRRTDKILEAVQKELNRQRGSLNSMQGVRSVIITIKLKKGTDDPRAIILGMDTEVDIE